MKIKDLKIKIAMALTLVMVGAPAVKALAAEPKTTDDFLQMDNKEYMTYIGKEFVKEFGRDDKFQTTFEDSDVIEQVNGKTGEVKAMEKGTNEEIYDYNYLDSLKARAEESQTTATKDTKAAEEYSSTLTAEQYQSVDKENLSASDIQKQVEQIKKDIQAKYGTENELKVVSDDGHVVQELNPATGDYKLTYKDGNTSCSYNYYDELNQVVKEAQSNTNK